MSNLYETAADVSALIPQYSWEIMDEAQRDELIEKIVLPRYMKTTSDGTNLGPSWWSDSLGATAEAIRNRVKRLQASQKCDSSERSAERNYRAERAKAMLKEATSEELSEIASSLAPEQKAELIRAALDHKLPSSKKAKNVNGNSRFVEAEGLFGSIKSKVHRLFEIRREADFSSEHEELFLDSARELRSFLDLLILSAEGDTEIDWDSELARISNG